jgi:uncharacterized membrane protein YkvA (DUF1232 family)
MLKIKNGVRPYVAQFKRSPLWVKIVAVLCVAYLVMPIDPWDVLLPWLAFHDDIFVAGLLLKLLHKYGGLPDEDPMTPRQLLTNIRLKVKAGRDPGKKLSK